MWRTLSTPGCDVEDVRIHGIKRSVERGHFKFLAGGPILRNHAAILASAFLPKKVVAQKFLFGEHRGRNIRKAALAALNMLRVELLNIEPKNELCGAMRCDAM